MKLSGRIVWVMDWRPLPLVWAESVMIWSLSWVQQSQTGLGKSSMKNDCLCRKNTEKWLCLMWGEMAEGRTWESLSYAKREEVKKQEKIKKRIEKRQEGVSCTSNFHSLKTFSGNLGHFGLLDFSKVLIHMWSNSLKCWDVVESSIPLFLILSSRCHHPTQSSCSLWIYDITL